MELDSFREIWQEAGDKAGSQPGNAEITEMLNKSSNSPIAKMKYNVLAEALVIVVLFGGIAIYFFIAFKGMFNSVSWLYIITAALCVVYYYRKWKLLNEMQCVACRVKSNLQKQVRTLERYVRFYLLGGTILVPFLFVFLAVLFYSRFPAGSFLIMFPSIQKSGGATIISWIIWVVFLTLITTLTYYGNRWFINRLYSQHIRRLQQILDQMEED